MHLHTKIGALPTWFPDLCRDTICVQNESSYKNKEDYYEFRRSNRN